MSMTGYNPTKLSNYTSHCEEQRDEAIPNMVNEIAAPLWGSQ
jgi:hypothetical protein